MNSIQEELTKTVAKMIAENYDNGFKSGFYSGQAMAGVELDKCHENWKKFTEKVS